MNSNTYVFKILLAIDDFVAALIPGWRVTGVSISSYTGLELRKPAPKPWAIVLGRWLLEKVQKGHCEGAILHDQERAMEALTILGYFDSAIADMQATIDRGIVNAMYGITEIKK